MPPPPLTGGPTQMPQRKRSCSRPELPHKTFIDTMVCGFVIVIKKNGTDGDKYPMVNDECLLGRGEGCDIRIELPGASKEHARIKVQAYSHRKVYTLHHRSIQDQCYQDEQQSAGERGAPPSST